MSAPIRPPLANKRCCACPGEVKGRHRFCAKCKRERIKASKRQWNRKRKTDSTKARLDRIEALLAQLVALGGVQPRKGVETSC